MKTWIRRLIFVLGFLIICYPVAESARQALYQHRAIRTVNTAVDELNTEAITAMRERAVTYNELLYEVQNGSILESREALSDYRYEDLLATTDTGIMGSIRIPKIDVDLPIYHGTSDEVLQIGVGHQEGTSLPVGEDHKHVVLTGHRGLPSAKLFTRLDEMAEGDLFLITTLNETAAYEVREIQVLEPDQAAEFAMKKTEEDRVSLVTCTPYGINSHRLVVTGVRVPYEEQTMAAIHSSMPSIREIALTALPFVILLFLLIRLILYRRKRKQAGVIKQADKSADVSANEDTVIQATQDKKDNCTEKGEHNET